MNGYNTGIWNGHLEFWKLVGVGGRNVVIIGGGKSFFFPCTANRNGDVTALSLERTAVLLGDSQLESVNKYVSVLSFVFFGLGLTMFFSYLLFIP